MTEPVPPFITGASVHRSIDISSTSSDPTPPGALELPTANCCFPIETSSLVARPTIGRDVLGPVDKVTQVKPSTRAPPVKRPTKSASRKRKPWAILIPSFEGLPDNGPGSGLGNDDAGKVLGRTKGSCSTDGARDVSAPPVVGRGEANAEDKGQIHKAENGAYGLSNGDESGDKELSRPPFFDAPVYQAMVVTNVHSARKLYLSRMRFTYVPKHPFLRYDASLCHRGGGRGYVASSDLAPGTLLLVERRFFPMPSPMDCEKAGSMAQEELCLKWILELPVPRLVTVLKELRWLHPGTLEDLTQDVAADLMARHEETARRMLSELSKEALVQTGLDVRGVVRLFGVLQSNGFASGIYLHHAMTNHSCRPNAVKWQGRPHGRPRLSAPLGQDRPNATQDGQENAHEAYTEMRATELIHEGDEITLSYLEPREIARQSRRKQLKEQFGFDCDCRLCGAGEGKTKPLEDFIQDHGAQEKTRPEYAPVPPAPVNGGDIASRSNPHSVDPDPKPVERPKYERSTGWQSSPDPTSPNVEVESPSMDTFQNAEVDVEEADDLGTKGLMAVNILERNLDAVERVIGFTKKGEVRSSGKSVNSLARLGAAKEREFKKQRRWRAATLQLRWAGLLSELLAYRGRAASILSCRHIALARADKLIAKACVAILGGSLRAAESDPECVEAVRVTSDALPSSFGTNCSAGLFARGATDDLHLGNEFSNGSTTAAPGGGCGGGDGSGGGIGRVRSSVRHFKTRLLAVLAAALLSRRMTQALYLGDCPHPEAGECLAELSQSLGMLLAQGSEGLAWIRRLPGPDEDRLRHAENARSVPKREQEQQEQVSESPGIQSQPGTGGLQLENCGRNDSQTSWWGDDEISSASSFERECDKAARRIGRLFDSFPYQEQGGSSTNTISNTVSR